MIGFTYEYAFTFITKNCFFLYGDNYSYIIDIELVIYIIDIIPNENTLSLGGIFHPEKLNYK